MARSRTSTLVILLGSVVSVAIGAALVAAGLFLHKLYGPHGHAPLAGRIRLMGAGMMVMMAGALWLVIRSIDRKADRFLRTLKEPEGGIDSGSAE
jgi:hypothetical protein